MPDPRRSACSALRRRIAGGRPVATAAAARTSATVAGPRDVAAGISTRSMPSLHRGADVGLGPEGLGDTLGAFLASRRRPSEL